MVTSASSPFSAARTSPSAYVTQNKQKEAEGEKVVCYESHQSAVPPASGAFPTAPANHFKQRPAAQPAQSPPPLSLDHEWHHAGLAPPADQEDDAALPPWPEMVKLLQSLAGRLGSPHAKQSIADTLALAQQSGSSPLYFAAQQGNLAVVKRLLQMPSTQVNQIVVELPDTAGAPLTIGTPLYAAARKGHAATVEELLKVPGIEPDKKLGGNQAPIDAAIEQGDTEIVELIVKAMRRMGRMTAWWLYNKLRTAAGQGQSGITTVLLKELRAHRSVDQRDALNLAICTAAEKGHVETVARLLELDCSGRDVLADLLKEFPEWESPNAGFDQVKVRQTLLACQAFMQTSSGKSGSVPNRRLANDGIDTWADFDWDEVPSLEYALNRSTISQATKLSILKRLLRGDAGIDDCSALRQVRERDKNSLIQAGRQFVATFGPELQRLSDRPLACVAAYLGAESWVQDLLDAPEDQPALVQSGEWVNGSATMLERLRVVAAEQGSHNLVARMLKQIGEMRPTALFEAAEEGDVSVVAQLLRNPDIDVNQPVAKLLDTDSESAVIVGTPLYIAAREGHVEVVRKLLDHPQIDAFSVQSYADESPLRAAIRRGNVEVIKCFLEKLNKLTWLENKHVRASIAADAAEHGRVEILDLLLSDSCPFDVLAEAFRAVATHGCAEMVPILLQHKEKFNIKEPFSLSALFIADLRGHVRVVEKLVKASHQLFGDDCNMTPALLVSQQGRRQEPGALTQAFLQFRRKEIAPTVQSALSCIAYDEKYTSLYQTLDQQILRVANKPEGFLARLLGL